MLKMICSVWYNVLEQTFSDLHDSSEIAQDHKHRSLWIKNEKSLKFGSN